MPLGVPGTTEARKKPHRRPGWRAVAVLAGTVALAGASAAGGQAQTSDSHAFVTRPDLHPPVIDMLTPARGTEPGSTFLAPMPVSAPESERDGPMIADDQGQPVWFAPDAPGVTTMDHKVQQYQGAPVMTWWQGGITMPPGFGRGEHVIMDQSYRQIATVRAGNGVQADLHDFEITPQNTALLVGYRDVQRDLTPIGGAPNAMVTEGVVQEVDIATGDVLFEWNSTAHVPEDESFVPPPPDPAVPWDYFHINSVELDGEGNLLVSARNTHAAYQINRSSGAVNWRLNGKKSDFQMGPGAGFEWQHDVRRLPDGSISVFDNGAPPKDRSRGTTLQVDETARTAGLAREDNRPVPLLSASMGNYQALAGGNAFAGWGEADGFTEFGPDSSVRMDGKLPEGMASYRAFRFPWVGRPLDAPAVAGQSEGAGTAVRASWNGATEVRSWRVLAGPDSQHLRPVQEGPRTGFETRIDAPGHEAYVAVEALDSSGAVLGTSPPVQVSQ